jgi:outer membrane protein OmpA-like peptidoglycan-associated protein
MRLASLLCVFAALPASADERWVISADVPLAVPVSAAQRDLFGGGGMPAFAVYRSLAPWVLVGGRLRVGLLADGPPPAAGMNDPGLGGFGSLSLAMRFRVPEVERRGSGPWLEIAAGAGLTGNDVRPTWEAGIGWGLALGSMDIGPTLRVLRVESTAGPMDPGAATIALVGLEVTFLDGSRPVPVLAQTPPPAAPPAPPPPPPAREPEVAVVVEPPKPEPEPDADGDGIPDRSDKCPNEPEVVNGVEDDDGCPDVGAFVVENDRIVLEERVLFDVNRARVKHRGHHVLDAIAALWRRHPEWTRMIVEGHADVRGSDRFNEWLSRTRADRVKAVMEDLSFSAGRVEAVGYGARRLRDPGRSETAHQRNRRVEFVIVRDGRTVQR